MPDHKSREWYSNKEIFEKIINLSEELIVLRAEMRETRVIIKNYNGLREKIKEIEKDQAVIDEQIQTIVNREEGRSSVWQGVKDWGGWIFGLITLLVLVYNQLFGL